MADKTIRPTKRVLDPIDRVSEVLFGLIYGPHVHRVVERRRYSFGSITGRHRWLVGMAMVVLGSILVGMTIVLGG